MPQKVKRVNKTKAQMIAEAKHLDKVNREKALVKLMFPLVVGQKSIYDGQTVLSALGGFIKMDLDKKMSEVVVKDLNIDLSKEKDSEIKTAILSILGLIELENARDVASLLERFGSILAQYSANEFMKQPMNVIKIEDLTA